MKQKAEPWERGAVHLQPDLRLLVFRGRNAVEARLTKPQAVSLAHALIVAAERKDRAAQ